MSSRGQASGFSGLRRLHGGLLRALGGRGLMQGISGPVTQAWAASLEQMLDCSRLHEFAGTEPEALTSLQGKKLIQEFTNPVS